MASAILAGLAARVVFWIYTDRTWEDALIALSHVRNAVAGIGLTSHPGEGRIEGFSSPLGVLVPLAAEAVVRGSGLAALRVAALAAFVVACLAAASICNRLDLGAAPTAFVLLYLAFDFLQVFYGMSGMETEMAVAVILCGVAAAVTARPVRSGLAMGLALLARPEFVLWLVPNAVALLRQGRRGAARGFALAAAIATPWFVFAWAYYGNLVPLSVRAKSTSYGDLSGLSPGDFHPLHWLKAHLLYHLPMWRLIVPFRDDTLVLRAPVPDPVLGALALGLAVLAVLGAWRTRHVRGWGPALFFCAAFIVYRVALLPEGYFDWYWPPVLAIFMILVGAGLESAHGWIARPGPGRHVGPRPFFIPAVAALLSLAFAVPLIYRLPLERRVQVSIEDHVRRPVGEYLGEQVRPGQVVVTEAAGYFGYYSNVRLMDYPGLTSPAAVTLLQRLPRSQRDLPHLVQGSDAAWLVLRPFEIRAIEHEFPGTLNRYIRVREFSTLVSIDQGGIELANIDRDYIVMRLR